MSARQQRADFGELQDIGGSVFSTGEFRDATECGVECNSIANELGGVTSHGNAPRDCQIRFANRQLR